MRQGIKKTFYICEINPLYGTSVYAKMPCINFGEVLHKDFLPEIRITLEAVLLQLRTKITPGWPLIQVNFDHVQEIGPKVGGGCSFVSRPLFRETTVYVLCI